MLYGEEAVEGLRWKTSIARFSQNNAQIGIKAAGACPQSKLGPIKPPLPKVIITFCGRKRRISERPALSEAKAALSEFGERAVGAYKPCPGVILGLRWCLLEAPSAARRRVDQELWLRTPSCCTQRRSAAPVGGSAYLGL